MSDVRIMGTGLPQKPIGSHSSMGLALAGRPNSWTRPPGSFPKMARQGQLLMASLTENLRPMREQTARLVGTLETSVGDPAKIARGRGEAVPDHQRSFLGKLSVQSARYQGQQWFTQLQADYQQHLSGLGRSISSEGEWVGMEAAMEASRQSAARGQRVGMARSVISWAKGRNQWNREIKSFLKESLAQPEVHLGEKPGFHWLLNASQSIRMVQGLHHELVSIKDDLKAYKNLHKAVRGSGGERQFAKLEAIQSRIKAKVIEYHRHEARLFHFLNSRLGLLSEPARRRAD